MRRRLACFAGDSQAPWLSEWENPRTETEYHDALVFKLAIFQTLNYFAPLLYIAFLKTGVFPLTDINDACMNVQTSVGSFPDCVYELEIQLFSIFLGKLAIKNGTRFLITPLLGALVASVVKSTQTAANFCKGDTVYFERYAMVVEKDTKKGDGKPRSGGGDDEEGQKKTRVSLGRVVGEVLEKGNQKLKLRYKVMVDADGSEGGAEELHAPDLKYKIKYVDANDVEPHLTVHSQMEQETYETFDLVS